MQRIQNKYMDGKWALYATRHFRKWRCRFVVYKGGTIASVSFSQAFEVYLCSRISVLPLSSQVCSLSTHHTLTSATTEEGTPHQDADAQPGHQRSHSTEVLWQNDALWKHYSVFHENLSEKVSFHTSANGNRSESYWWCQSGGEKEGGWPEGWCS